jgi:hypothetical protein
VSTGRFTQYHNARVATAELGREWQCEYITILKRGLLFHRSLVSKFPKARMNLQLRGLLAAMTLQLEPRLCG